MQSSNSMTSDFRQRRLFGELMRSLQQRMRQRFVMLLCAVTLLALVTLLSGCHTLPSQPCEMQPLPTPPALTEPTPLVSYSEQWRKLVETSRLKLIATPVTPKP